MNNRRDEDLDWLYRQEDEPEPTRVFTAEERAHLQGTPASPRGSSPHPDARAEQSRGSRSAPPPPPPARPPRQRRRRRRRPVRRFLATLVVLWLVFMVGTPLFAWLRTTVVEATPSGERPDGQPGTATLLVGSDAREDLTAEERSRLGTGSSEGRRTDTMMLLYTPPTGRSALVSLPRDSFVTIPGEGDNKLNAAYAFGGPSLLVATVEQATGVRVDGYLEVGMLGLVNTVDAVGGIEVCLDEAISDRDSHLELEAGCQTLDGVQALGYVRMRKADPRGDLGRVERQRDVIAQVSKKALNPLTLLNPVSYWRLNMAVASSVARGSDTGLGEVFGIGRGVAASAFGNGMSMTVPVASDNASTSAGSAVIWDEAASAEMFDAIAGGDTAALEKFER